MNENEIKKFADKIASQNDVYKIILYNKKTALSGDFTSFKICVILNNGSASDLEREIYIQNDLPIPFDVLVYKKERWIKLCEQQFSFASRIEEMGTKIYG